MTCSKEGSGKLWDSSSGKLVRVLAHMLNDRDNFNKIVLGLAFSPDTQFAFTGGLDRLMKMWRVDTGELLETFTAENGVRSIGCGSNLLVAAGCEKGTFAILRAKACEGTVDTTKTTQTVLKPIIAEGGTEQVVVNTVSGAIHGSAETGAAIQGQERGANTANGATQNTSMGQTSDGRTKKNKKAQSKKACVMC